MSTPFAEKTPETIHRQRVGEIPLLLSLSKRLGLPALLARYVKSHANLRYPTADSLLLLLLNLTSGRQPLYELEQWVLSMDSRLFDLPCFEQDLFNDDRFGRALDRLYQADRASLMTQLAMTVVQVFELDLSRVHNDSTSIKAFGKIPGTTRNGLSLQRGISKDHRPDLKQLVFSLSICADGAVPIHYKTYPGNRTDDTTHIETWNCLTGITGRVDFLYVADCKVCTDKQLSHIVSHGGRVLTVVPETWKETQSFKSQLLTKTIPKKRIWRIPIPGRRGQYETFSCFLGHYLSSKAGYPIHWIYSSEKKKRDRQNREDCLRWTEQHLAHLTGKLNTGKLKTRSQILERAATLVDKHKVAGFYHLKISEVKEKHTRQIGKGRPGRHTRYRTITATIYSLSWTRNREALKRQQHIDGIFPILCTDPKLSAKQVLQAYKYQPKLEKRFCQFKTVHNAAPLLFKKIERVEAMMFVFFLALILQAALEREIRLKMKKNKIEALPLYPEHRIAYHPTTAKIIDCFHEVSNYQLKEGQKVIKEYRDHLSPLQKQILDLLDIQNYWPK